MVGIHRAKGFWITLTDSSGETQSRSVEANLLYEILQELKKKK